MQTADFNHQDFAAGHEQEADKALLVRFFMREMQNKAESMKQGRPIYKETEFVEIRVAGKRDPQVCRPAREADKQRFPEHYRRFKARVAEPNEGTPLSQWPQINRAQVEELAFLNIKTVEQLAEISDGNATNFHGGLTLKRRAQEWLEQADQSKLIAEKEELNATIADLKAKIEALEAGRVNEPTNSVEAVETPDLNSDLDGAAESTPQKPTRRTRRKKIE